jgi:eukaryotic-like serine/threonine-protein kinase
MRHIPRDVVRPGQRVEGYVIERQLGEGGFGDVYLARRDGALHALKFIHPASVGDWGWRELYILQRHEFPQVVRLLGHFKWPEPRPEYLVLVMEYVPGPTLYQWARDTNPCTREVVEKVERLAQVLQTVHARRVLHRDVKGDNVLVRASDGAPVLVDFGAGTMRGVPRVTQEGLAPANARYRSPESVAFFLRADRAPGERYPYAVTDELYALGVLLYVLLTDSYPFQGPEERLMADSLESPVTPPSVRNGRVPPALDAVCARLLAKEPSARFQSAEAVGAELRRVREAARGDARWALPLCYGWTAEGHTTEKVLAVEDERRSDRARRLARRTPRRGPRPEPRGETSRPMHRALPLLLPLGVALAVGLWMVQKPRGAEDDAAASWTRGSADGALARPGGPPRLVPNQKQPPCTAGLEREVSGGCWLSLEQTPPNCPEQTVAHEGRCLLPVVKSPTVPVSLDAGGP